MSEELEGALIQSLGDSVALDLLSEVGELTLDAFLDESLVREIPILRGIIGVTKTFRGVRDFLFARKVAAFLRDLRTVPETERRKFVEKMDRDPKQRKRVGATVLMVLDRFADLEKPPILAAVFRALIRGTVDYATFRRLAAAVDTCLVEDLAELSLVGHNSPLSQATLQSLANAGLAEIAGIPVVWGPGAETKYRLSELGRQMEDILKAAN